MADKSSKAGRNSDFCKAYRSSARQEQNALKRLLRDLKRRQRFSMCRRFNMNLSECMRASHRVMAGVRKQELRFKCQSYVPDEAHMPLDWQKAYARCQATLPNSTFNRIYKECMG